MNKSFFFAEGFNLLDNVTLKEKLDEFDAPPWSPSFDSLSPIKKVDTAFCEGFESSTEMETFNNSKLELRFPESIEEEEEESTAHIEPVEKISIPPTPKVRKPISLILSRIRKIDFDIPEDYELPVKSTNTIDIDTTRVDETSV